MIQTGAPGATIKPVRKAKRRGIWPALGLFFLAPLIAEFLLGNLPIKLLAALVVLAPMYGGGALLIRELVRRNDRGWPSIFLLGTAYAIFEEAFTTQSLFNPDYMSLKLGLLTPAFLPALGISGWWTLWMLNVHAGWSIATPIALVEASVPDRASTPWLGRIGLVATAILFCFGTVTIAKSSYKTDHFMASIRQFAMSALIALVLGIVAFLLPRRAEIGLRMSGWVPSSWLAGIVTLTAGSLALMTPKDWGWGAVAVILALDLAVLTLVLLWSRRSGWGLSHKLGMAAGAALAYGWHAFMQRPVVGTLDSSVRIGNTVFLASAVGLICFAARRAANQGLVAEQDSSGAGGPTGFARSGSLPRVTRD
jgi:hypothetical protein